MINASEYDFRPYSFGSNPTISVSLNDSSFNLETVSSRCDDYLKRAEEYVVTIKEVFALRDYLPKRMMYDLAASKDVVSNAGDHCTYEFMTKGGSGVNYETNEITLHEKVDDTYNNAFNGLVGTTTVQNGIDAFQNAFRKQWLTDDKGECAYVITDNRYEAPKCYDEQALAVDNGDGYYCYIKDVPNAIGTERTYTCHSSDFEDAEIAAGIGESIRYVADSGWCMCHKVVSDDEAQTVSYEVVGEPLGEELPSLWKDVVNGANNGEDTIPAGSSTTSETAIEPEEDPDNGEP